MHSSKECVRGSENTAKSRHFLDNSRNIINLTLRFLHQFQLFVMKLCIARTREKKSHTGEHKDPNIFMSRTHNGDLGVPYEHNKIKEIPPPQYKGRADLELLVSRDGVKRFIDFCVARAIFEH